MYLSPLKIKKKKILQVTKQRKDSKIDFFD